MAAKGSDAPALRGHGFKGARVHRRAGIIRSGKGKNVFTQRRGNRNEQALYGGSVCKATDPNWLRTLEKENAGITESERQPTTPGEQQREQARIEHRRSMKTEAKRKERAKGPR